MEDANYVNQQNFNGGYRGGYLQGNPSYHLSNMNHPNFTWGNLNNALQSSSFLPSTQAPSEPKKPSMEDLIQKMMVKQDNFN